MYEYLKGTLIENQASYAIMDVNGVGYKVWIAAGSIPFSINQECLLYTSFVVRENAQILYGFSEKASRDLFETLIHISGIGPKTALCILSQFSADSFKEAVISQNISLISSVPGLGKKTAEKITLDLKDKLLKQSFAKGHMQPAGQNHNYDAIQALIHLGYSEKSAAKALEKVLKNNSKPMELSELITEALRQR